MSSQVRSAHCPVKIVTGLLLLPSFEPFEFGPSARGLRAFDAGFDEGHPPHAIVHRGDVGFSSLEKRRREVFVEVRERLEIPLGVAGGKPRRPERFSRKPPIVRPGPENLARPIRPLEKKCIRLLLAPLEAPLLPVDPEVQAVLFIDRDLARPENAPRAASEAKKNACGIVERSE